MSELIPKKSLGQHFLRSEKALSQIIETVKGKNKGETLIFEIGPGEGVLTEKILSLGFTLASIEIDKRSIELLKEKFKKEIGMGKFFIIESDCLEIDYVVELEKINKNFKEYFLLGNIPYYITGAIFRHTFENKTLPTDAVFLVQKEVAERVVARDKKESLLSVSVKIFGEAKIVDIVKAGSFTPPPKVDSAILSVSEIKSPFKSEERMKEFFKVLRGAFKQKRKLLLSNLKNEIGEEYLRYQKYFKEKERAEDVEISTWKKIIVENF